MYAPDGSHGPSNECTYGQGQAVESRCHLGVAREEESGRMKYEGRVLSRLSIMMNWDCCTRMISGAGGEQCQEEGLENNLNGTILITKSVFYSRAPHDL
jgi:hypothetical protein